MSRLGVGEAAPDFELRNQHGQPVRMSAFRGTKAVVVVFYPYAFSRVCSGELGEIRDHLSAYQNDGTALVAISCDPVYSLRVFADRDGLTFPLLSDFWPHGAVATRYGVFDSASGSADRSTFIVDRAGVLCWSVHNGRSDARSLTEYERVLASIG